MELGPILGGDIVLALPFLESDHRDLFRLGKRLDTGHKRPGHGAHQARRSERLTAMVAKETDHPKVPLQLRLIDIQVHAVDALYFERHVFADDLRNVP
jgi:hypothetical protein